MLDGVHPLPQRLDGVSGPDGHRLARDDRPGVDSRVHVVHGRGGFVSSGVEQVLQRMGAGKLRERTRMDVHDTLREALEERGCEEMHVPGADDELDTVGLEPVSHRAVAGFSVRVALERKDLGGHTRRLGPHQRLRPARVRGNRKTGRAASSSACSSSPPR